MISRLNGGSVQTTYQKHENKNIREQDETLNVSSQGDTSHIEAIKASIEQGDYKLDLQALAEKIADELM